MKLGAVENKTRLALTLFVLALLLTIGLSLALYSQARRELASERIRLVKLEVSLLATALSNNETFSETLLAEHLHRVGIIGAAALYGPNGGKITSASTLDRAVTDDLLQPRFYPMVRPDPNATSAPIVLYPVRSEGGFDVAESPSGGSGRVIVLARPVESESTPVIFYVFSYQIIALLLGLGLILLLIRWLVKPYRRMVEAARGSPVRAPNAVSESEFVVETFQALIEQLQTKERELAQLHESERRRAEKSERFSERLIANIPSGLVTIDPLYKVNSANAQAQEIFRPSEGVIDSGFETDSSNGLRALSVDYRVFFERAPRMAELISECLTNRAAFRREEVEVVDTDGRVKHLGLSISPITDVQHNLEGALCLMTDITEVIELRERMKVQEGMANLGEMAAGLAHEFKNSLATIQGYVQLLDSLGTSEARLEDRARTLNSALNEVRLLARLVTDFLNFAKPQQISPTEIDLKDMLEDCASEIAPLLRETDISITIAGSFVTINGDEPLLRRAFVNLLRNAAEAIDPLSPERAIEVTGSIDGGPTPRHAHVRIRDTGTGIAKDDLRRIFIPFFTTKSRGYGIGLALVQKILVAHGGSVLVERSDERGTVFRCRLPVLPKPLAMEEKAHIVH